MENLIGITGGIGCGKSTLIKMLCEKYNCYSIDTDSIAKELMLPGEFSYRLIVEYFGTDILREDGTIDSKKLGAIVMNDEIELEMLNKFTHPYVIKKVKEIAEKVSSSYDVVIIESALLLDTPLKNLCDEIWNVSADENKRIERLCTYRGYTKQQAEDIMRNQPKESWYEENSIRTFINNRDGGADMVEMMKVSMSKYIL